MGCKPLVDLSGTRSHQSLARTAQQPICTNTLMLSQSLRDIAVSLERHQLWRTLGWADIRFRYRRTVLGPFWLTLRTGVMVFAIGLLYAGLLHQDISSYLPFLAIGIIICNFFSTSTNEGCSVFIGAAGFIKAYAMPLSIYVLRLLWRNIIIFLHNFVIVIVIWTIFRW
jgi:ABC-type polysaccharide/polyol phosphate export permease